MRGGVLVLSVVELHTVAWHGRNAAAHYERGIYLCICAGYCSSWQLQDILAGYAGRASQNSPAHERANGKWQVQEGVQVLQLTFTMP